MNLEMHRAVAPPSLGVRTSKSMCVSVLCTQYRHPPNVGSTKTAAGLSALGPIRYGLVSIFISSIARCRSREIPGKNLSFLYWVRPLVSARVLPAQASRPLAKSNLFPSTLLVIQMPLLPPRLDTTFHFCNDGQ